MILRLFINIDRPSQQNQHTTFPVITQWLNPNISDQIFYCTK